MKDKFLATALIVLLCLLAYNITTIRDSDAGKVMIKASGETTSTTPATTTAANDACGDDMAYTSLWNGEYADHSDYMCVSSTFSDGALGGTAAIHGDYAQGTGYGLRIDSQNDYLEFGDLDPSLISTTEGTIWMSVRVNSTPTGDATIFEAAYDTDNAVYFGIRTTGVIRGYYEAQANIDTVTSTDTVALDGSAWSRIAYSWNRTTGYHTVKVGAGIWLTPENELGHDFASAPDNVAIGEKEMGGGTTITSGIDIDNVYILSTYQAADPL